MNAQFLPAHPKASNAYEVLRKVNVNDKIEKKNGLSYLSWAFAVDTLLQHDPDASWEYPESKQYGETLMVFCAVTAFGRTRTAQLPVMNHMNKAIANPDAFAVNTAMQRCLVKAIALHGLGLYIYAGEDLPEEQTGKHDPRGDLGVNISPDFALALAEKMRAILNADHEENIVAMRALDLTDELRGKNDEYAAAWKLMDSKERSAWKRYVDLGHKLAAQEPKF